MPLLVNLRHLANDDLSLKGSLPLEELDLTLKDELVQAKRPLEYDLQVEKMDQSLLLQGSLELILDCECSRCLKPFEYKVKLDHWACHVPLEGEDKAPINSDCVDLTPYIREDILLEFPQHPLCEQECSGLPKAYIGKAKTTSNPGPRVAGASAWDELNKLKF